MCGICGITYFDGRPVNKDKLHTMMNRLIHRGPDDHGDFFNQTNGTHHKTSVGLGFRRLSIIDLKGGHQPMKFENWSIVFNGEIYNFRELRSECQAKGHQFRTNSDTEVLLHLIDLYGESAVKRLNGMYAFACWNEKTQELLLARDRIGIKPLYYYIDDKKCIFSSEIKSLLGSEDVPFELDPTAVLDFFTYRFVAGPHTIVKNIKKVLPGHILKVKNGKVTESSYWRLEKDNSSWSVGSLEESENELLRLMSLSVQSQMVSDVPLGSFLSGGVDSSLITALMVQYSSSKIQTFSIGFEKSSGVDESRYARKVSKVLGTEHNEFILNEKDLLQSESLFSTMNEPVADPTILPTAILSEFTRKKVKVVLTGEGGDELFGGYNRYKSLLYSRWVHQMPKFIQPLAGAVMRKSGKGESFQAIPQVNSRNWYSLQKDFSPDTLQFYFKNGSLKSNQSYLKTETHPFFNEAPLKDPLNQVLDLERQTALVDRLLMKVDMASMSHSLEARPPFLDHRVVEFAFKIPDYYKIKSFMGKYILRSAARKLLPSDICWRRKHGFIVPIGKWIYSHSQDWFDGYLHNPVLDSSGIFDKKSIQNEFKKIYNSRDIDQLSVFWPYIVLSGWIRGLRN